MLGSEDPGEAMGRVLAGYHQGADQSSIVMRRGRSSTKVAATGTRGEAHEGAFSYGLNFRPWSANANVPAWRVKTCPRKTA